jgi:nitrogen fixation protein NifU and related proteins
MDLYAENILDHYRSPRGTQPIAGEVIEHHEENASCGDELTVRLRINDGKIEALSWSGTGCAISQAAMSMLSEEVADLTADAVLALKPKDIFDLLGVPIGPRRMKCALLGLHAVRNTLRRAKGKSMGIWTDLAGNEN